jgi:hypothetical protein
MMNVKPGALASLVLLVACTIQSPAQHPRQVPPGDLVAPEPINLDIPPVEPPNPAKIREKELATLAALKPEDFHEWLLQEKPERRALEEAAAFAILAPDLFRKAHPRTPAQVRAEAAAAHAIMNPRFPFR